MNSVGVTIAGCAVAFLGGAFLIDSPGKFAVGLLVMLGVGIFAASLDKATK